MASSGINAYIEDLDELVDLIRNHGAPGIGSVASSSQSQPSQAPTASQHKAKIASSSNLSSSTHHASTSLASNAHPAPHVPVGGVPVPKHPKASAASSSTSASSASAKSSIQKPKEPAKTTSSATPASKKTAAASQTPSAASASYSVPKSNANGSQAAPPLSSASSHGVIGQPPGGQEKQPISSITSSASAQPSFSSNFMPYNLLDDPYDDDDSMYGSEAETALQARNSSISSIFHGPIGSAPAASHPVGSSRAPPPSQISPQHVNPFATQPPGITIAPGPHYHPSAPHLGMVPSPYHAPYYGQQQQQQPQQHQQHPIMVPPPQQAPQQSQGMQLRMRQYAYGPSMELRIHTPLFQTESSLIYGSNFSHNWMIEGTSQEVIVKLFRLSTDLALSAKQQAQVESEFLSYSSFNHANHPNLLTTYAREDKIEIGSDQFALVVMERCHYSLSTFLVQHMTNTTTFVSPGSEPTMMPSTSLGPDALRGLADQLVQGYLFLHRCGRFCQRHIYPANILVSKSIPGSNNAQEMGGIPDLAPGSTLSHTLKVHDFNFSGAPSVPNDPVARCFMSPEAAMEQFGNLQACDLWAIGCVIYFIATGGNMLFMNEAERDDLPKRMTYMRRHGLHQNHPLLIDLVLRLTMPKPEDRPHLEVIRHHPALWSPTMVVTFVCQVSRELEKSNSSRAGLIYDIVASPDFFQHAFPKATSWESYVMPSWLETWKSWNALEGKQWDERFFKSTRTLLRFLSTMADNFAGGHHGRAQFGTILSQRLHHFILALWSHLQQIGEFDNFKHFSFL
jgi:hypothetical protein